MCVDYWFSIWSVRNEPVWTLGFVAFLLLLGSLLYLTCHVVMPDVDHGRPVDLVEFRDSRPRRYLSAFFAYQAAGGLGAGPGARGALRAVRLLRGDVHPGIVSRRLH